MRERRQVHRDPLVEELVEELHDRVAFLEWELERRSVEAERYQQIVADLTQTNNQLASRLREIEAPQEPPGGPQSTAGESEGGEALVRYRRFSGRLRVASGHRRIPAAWVAYSSVAAGVWG